MSYFNVGDVFWCEGDSPIANVVHKISAVSSGTTPADSECEECEALCGASGQSWFSPRMGVSMTLVAKKPPLGAVLCPVCFLGAEKQKEPEWSRCPKCGQYGVCHHDGDVSAGPTYVDQYRFECSNPSCRFTDSQAVCGGDTVGDNWHTKCPYCGVGGD